MGNILESIKKSYASLYESGSEVSAEEYRSILAAAKPGLGDKATLLSLIAIVEKSGNGNNIYVKNGGSCVKYVCSNPIDRADIKSIGRDILSAVDNSREHAVVASKFNYNSNECVIILSCKPGNGLSTKPADHVCSEVHSKLYKPVKKPIGIIYNFNNDIYNDDHDGITDVSAVKSPAGTSKHVVSGYARVSDGDVLYISIDDIDSWNGDDGWEVIGKLPDDAGLAPVDQIKAIIKSHLNSNIIVDKAVLPHNGGKHAVFKISVVQQRSKLTAKQLADIVNRSIADLGGGYKSSMLESNNVNFTIPPGLVNREYNRINRLSTLTTEDIETMEMMISRYDMKNVILSLADVLSKVYLKSLNEEELSVVNDLQQTIIKLGNRAGEALIKKPEPRSSIA